ncbi:hypothetical protein H2203_001396 [Taxawa tesnikishii (nom. ined.)]|nr:hypothetical protein H2203_001396 [Dothideales sp. JES 119]
MANYHYEEVNHSVADGLTNGKSYSSVSNLESAQYDAKDLDNHHLPPRTFATARRTRLQRALCQTSVGVGAGVVFFAAPLLAYLYGFADAATYDGPEKCTAANNLDNALAPDTVYGNFTLGQAKGIDLAWNAVIGRGGTALFGILIYRIITNSLLRVAEMTGVSYELFATLSLHHTIVYSFLPLLKAVFELKGWRPKLIMLWLGITMAVLLALPTALDGMTGYIQAQEALWSFQNGTAVPYSTTGPSDRLNNVTRRATGEVICTPTFGYQWGFSSTWILMSMSFFFMWGFGTYCVWLDTQWGSQLVRKGRTMGTWRAIADLAEAMKEELGPHTGAYSESELQNALSKRGSSSIGLRRRKEWSLSGSRQAERKG